MTATEAVTASRSNQLSRGIAYMVASTVAFAGVNAIVKWAVARYPVGEVTFYRSLFAFVAVAVAILPRRGIAVFRAARRFTTLLAIGVRKEKVGIHRLSARARGFVGVLVIAHPGAGTLQPGAVFALANAILISSVAVAIRKMSETESPETMTLYQMAIMTGCTLFLLPLGFTSPGWRDAAMLAGAGIGNGIAQIWWTRSLSLAPPSAVVPFNYLSLVWAMILGYLVWGDVPGLDLLLGAAIVVASGLYILWRETLRRAARRA